MSRPRVLCVSADRSTRATVTLSLTDAPVDVVIAQDAPRAVDRLERERIDAVVVDATSVPDVSGVVDAVETHTPESPAFVYWGERDDEGVVLSEVLARTDRTAPSERLAALLVDRVVAGADGALRSGTEPAAGPESAGADVDVPEDLEAVRTAVRCRLVDARSPVTVERVVREECTAVDRFDFTWVGEFDRGEREIVPWLTDLEAMTWSLGRTFPIGSGDQPLLERALETRDLQVVRDVEGRRDAVPLGEQAVDRDVRSVVVAPLASPDRLFGVLVVYATDPVSPADRETIRSIARSASAVLETIVVRGRLEQRERALIRYERLVETAGDGMYVLDDQGHFTTVNDALVEMTGYAREGLLGEHASILIDDADVAESEETIRSLLADGGGTDTVEMTLETKAGETIPSEAQLAVIVRGEEFLGSVGVIRDITERKRKERMLREQNERLDAFAKIVSHDLRNPLSVSQGYLDLIEDTGSLDHVSKVRDGLRRMESIVDDVLAIARDGEWATEAEPVDLEAVALDAWENVSTGEATLSVGPMPTVEADRSRLLRLLENLFRNAIEHGGSDVAIRVGPLEDRDGFFVADDGEGIAPEVRENLFDPSVSSSSEGLGIGLWIVREVATGHGWTVSATESRSGGARFEFDVGDQSSD